MDIFDIGSKHRTKEVNGVRIRSLTALERSRVEAALAKVQDGDRTPKAILDVRWVACSAACIDEDGNQLFKDGDRQRFNELQTWFLEPIFEGILELSAVTDADREAFEGN